MAALVKKTKIAESFFGQLVIGPPGSGKTTYCGRIYSFYKTKLNRNVAVVNLDPANENMNYVPKIDIMQLITVQVLINLKGLFGTCGDVGGAPYLLLYARYKRQPSYVMENMSLGPNGALMYCMEYLESNFDWLLNQLTQIKDSYLIFDMPGQVELFTHHNSIKNICEKLEKLSYHLCAVHMVDSHYCSDPTKFISTLLLSLSTMMQIGLPHVNVLTKADLLKKNSSKLDFGIDFYTDVLDLDYLLELLDDGPFTKKYKKLNAALIGLVQDYSLVCFIPLNVKSDKSLLNLKNAIDKANGYIYGSGEERNIQALLACAVGARTESERFDADYM